MAKRRPLARPYRTQLACCSPDWQAWQVGRMHGARRKLSEPRIAGKAPAAWLSSQRLTSAGDSLLLISMCVTFRTFSQEGKVTREACKKSRFLRAILRFET